MIAIVERVRVGIAALLCAGLAVGCVQMPTEKYGIVELRPQLSFLVADPALADASVFIDGLDMGAVGTFMQAQSSLRVLPGTHLIKVVHHGRTLVEERFYIADGVSRTFLVSKGAE